MSLQQPFIPPTDQDTQLELKVTDINGRHIFSTKMNAVTGVHELNASLLNDGFYIIELLIDNQSVGCEKLEIIR